MREVMELLAFVGGYRDAGQCDVFVAAREPDHGRVLAGRKVWVTAVQSSQQDRLIGTIPRQILRVGGARPPVPGNGRRAGCGQGRP
ncbi:hypothetical protein D3C86_1822400 [compost metagenome]